MKLLRQCGIPANHAVGVRILDKGSKHVVADVERVRIDDHDLDPDRLCPGADHRDGLGMTTGGDEKRVTLFAALDAVTHRHRLGGSGRLVKQRRIRNLHRRQVGHHGLEIQ